MFLRRKPHRDGARNLEAEHVLVVVGRAGCKSMPPLRIDLESPHQVPAHEPLRPHVDPGFLHDFAPGGVFEGLFRVIDRAGDGLPVSGTRRTLDQQDLKSRRVAFDCDVDKIYNDKAFLNWRNFF